MAGYDEPESCKFNDGPNPGCEWTETPSENSLYFSSLFKDQIQAIRMHSKEKNHVKCDNFVDGTSKNLVTVGT
jgi:hypothetical protein